MSVWCMASQHILPSRWEKSSRKIQHSPIPYFFPPVYGGPAVSVRGVRTLFHPGQNGKPRETEVSACVLLPPFSPPPPPSLPGESGAQIWATVPPPLRDRFSFRVSGWARKGVPKQNGTLAHLGSTQVGEKKEETRKFDSFSTCCFRANQNRHGRTFPPKTGRHLKATSWKGQKKLP